MAEKGIDIQVATRANENRVGRLESAGITVHKLPFGGRLDIFTTWRLKQICSLYKPNIIQTWLSRAAQKAPCWKKSMRIPRYLIVSRLGGYYKISHFPCTDYYTTITPDIRRHLIKYGIQKGRVRHINNFAETEICEAPLTKSSLDTPENATVLIAFGRLHKAKALDILIRAVKPLPYIYVWIAGEGPLRDDLEKLARELEIEDRIKFLGWRNDRAALFQAADICVFPSRYEPFGTVFVQAWAHQKPLITTEASGPAQFVEHEKDALLVPVDDISSLNQAIARMAADKTLQKNLVYNGYKKYLREFTAEKTLHSYMRFYREILEREGLEEY
jgi:glycosyltransferase involved in cell wall biosynthesis